MMLFTAAGAGSIHLGSICLRLACAMMIGLIIGTEREYTHRPAGMRTHILVALGACSVMLTGQMLFSEYRSLGAAPDPARLGAQVITGVGFLGAGTILREGATVKGLTTAASLWSVACLGLAAGAGFFTIALTGMVCILLTLTVFEGLQHRLIGFHTDEQNYRLETGDIVAATQQISEASHRCRAELGSLHALTPDVGSYVITFHASFPGTGSRKRQQRFFESLAASPAFSAVSICKEPFETATP